MKSVQLIAICLVVSVNPYWTSRATPSFNPSSQTHDDPFQQRVAGLQLDEQTIPDGVAKLTQTVRGVTFAIELPLAPTISSPAPALPIFTASLGPGTLAEVLTKLCDLDQTFSWQRIGTVVHVLPRNTQGNAAYLLNRSIGNLEFQRAIDAEDALFSAVAQLGGPKEQIAIKQTGISTQFARPWTASFKDITVRETLDHIAEQFGPSYGWVFFGARDFRLVTFFERLSPQPPQGGPLAAR